MWPFTKTKPIEKPAPIKEIRISEPPKPRLFVERILAKIKSSEYEKIIIPIMMQHSAIHTLSVRLNVPNEIRIYCAQSCGGWVCYTIPDVQLDLDGVHIDLTEIERAAIREVWDAEWHEETKRQIADAEQKASNAIKRLEEHTNETD